jgi:hypothetical protein
MKKEILKAIENIEVHYSDFDHEYNWCRRTYAKCTKKIESENYNIEVEFEEEVRWTGSDEYEFIHLAITDLKIIDVNGTEIETDIKDNEILNLIIY